MKKAIMIMAIAAGLYACGGGETAETETKQEAKPVQQSFDSTALSLGGGQNITVGMPKSGHPWKKCGSRSSFHRPFVPKPFAVR